MAHTASPAHGTASGGGAIRFDIQALRAFAVMAVVLFHLWPAVFPGGYIGVDVFFVVSGFLITGQIVRARRKGNLRLGTFWAARARRLLPASLLVLLVSIVLTVMWAPATLQAQHLRSIIGSVFYIENWFLAADGVDYLAHDNAPPIAQHYWSLSVEEQFYVLWPLLIVLATMGAARRGSDRTRVLVVGAAVLGAASFAASVVLTEVLYPYGYFSTISRIWEFAIGALAVFAPRLVLPRAAHVALWTAAVAALIATVFLYGTDTPFPGPAALLPVAAAAVFIAIGPTPPAPFAERIVGLGPVQWLGDQSYGIYLWHWPLIVIAPAVLGRPVGLLDTVVLFVLTLVLAAATKRFVEDPIRFGRRTSAARPRSIAVVTVVAMAVSVVAAVIPIRLGVQDAEARQQAVALELEDPSYCRGAHLLLAPGCDAAPAVSADELVPAPAALAEDTGGAFGCYDYNPVAATEPTTCRIGAQDGQYRIALHGDSHAAMLVPGLREVAAQNGWTIDTYAGRGCVWRIPSADDCEGRNTAIEQILLSGEYDAILVTALNRPDFTPEDRERVAAGYAAAWELAEQAGVDVVVLADNPAVPSSSQECVSMTSEFGFATCSFPRSDSLLDVDPLRMAAASSDVDLIDLSGAFCDDSTCAMQLGGVLVYRDLDHITATFSRTLAPYLAERVRSAFANADQ